MTAHTTQSVADSGDAVPLRLDGIFRINTNVSAGAESLSVVADKAGKAGVDFIVVSDQFLVRAEYGLPPFRNVVKVWKTRKSVITIGVGEYLAEIAATDREHPNLIVVPGVDVAPHYFWTGSPVSELTIHQFSRQLTVFGSTDPELYRGLPVIHNEPEGTFFPHTILALTPLLIAAAGAVALARKRVFYRDAQGNEYAKPKRWTVKFAAVLAIVLGILWTLDNRPFAKPSFAQYADNGRAACQTTLDYVRKNDNNGRTGRVGVFWSAPEARSSQKMGGVALVTKGYVDDMTATSGSNGFAGIYADTSTERFPRSFWDEMLSQYISGARELPPFVVGERDYHGRGGVPIDRIKTVVFIRGKGKDVRPKMEDVATAIIDGHSYAVVKRDEREIILDRIELIAETRDGTTAHAIPGETLDAPRGASVYLRLRGHLIRSGTAERAEGTLTLVMDGERVLSQTIKLGNFAVETELPEEMARDGKRHYVRFNIDSKESGRIVCNPIFCRFTTAAAEKK